MPEAYLIKHTAYNDAATVLVRESTSFVIGPGELDGPGGFTRNSELRLSGFGLVNWGDEVNQNLFRLLEGNACPVKVLGDYNPTTLLFDYDPITDPILPKDENDLGLGNGITTPVLGQTWFNTSNQVTYTYSIISTGPTVFAWLFPGTISAGTLNMDGFNIINLADPRDLPTVLPGAIVYPNDAVNVGWADQRYVNVLDAQNIAGVKTFTDTLIVNNSGTGRIDFGGDGNDYISLNQVDDVFHIVVDGATAISIPPVLGSVNLLRNLIIDNIASTLDELFLGGTGAQRITADSSTSILRLYTNNTERVTIIDDGRVGIGTNNPQGALHVLTNNTNTLLLQRLPGTTESQIRFLDSGGSASSRIVNDASSNDLRLISEGSLSLQTVGIDHLNIDPVGNILIRGRPRINNTGTLGQLFFGDNFNNYIELDTADATFNFLSNLTTVFQMTPTANISLTPLDMDLNRILNVATPIIGTDGVNKDYVDAVDTSTDIEILTPSGTYIPVPGFGTGAVGAGVFLTAGNTYVVLASGVCNNKGTGTATLQPSFLRQGLSTGPVIATTFSVVINWPDGHAPMTAFFVCTPSVSTNYFPRLDNNVVARQVIAFRVL